MSNNDSYNILCSSVNGVINELKIFDSIIEKFRILNDKEQIGADELLNKSIKISAYVGKQIYTLKLFLLTNTSTNLNIEELNRIVYLLNLLLDSFNNAMDIELSKKGYEPTEWGLLTFNVDYAPIYQEEIEEYIKKLEFNY